MATLKTLPVKMHETTGHNGQGEAASSAGENQDTWRASCVPRTWGSRAGTWSDLIWLWLSPVPCVRQWMSAAAWISENEFSLYCVLSHNLPLVYRHGQIQNICHCPFNPGDILYTVYGGKALDIGSNNLYQMSQEGVWVGFCHTS